MEIIVVEIREKFIAEIFLGGIKPRRLNRGGAHARTREKHIKV
jgi:hypothetical protein